jgi:hypothetical protein
MKRSNKPFLAALAAAFLLAVPASSRGAEREPPMLSGLLGLRQRHLLLWRGGDLDALDANANG